VRSNKLVGAEAPYKQKLPAIRLWLIEVARQEGKVTYGETMRAFGIDRFSLRHGMDFLGHQSVALGEPVLTALIVSKATQRCSIGIVQEFDVRDDQAERESLYRFWRSNHLRDTQVIRHGDCLDVKAARFVSVEARPEQAAFRREVFLASGGRCVVSGCDVVAALDAAHRTGRSWRLGHNKAGDGYLLRKDLHALYDCGHLRITADGCVELDDMVLEYYRDFAYARIAGA